MMALALLVLSACGTKTTEIEYTDGNLGISVDDLKGHLDAYLKKYADEGTELIQTSQGTYTYIMKDGVKLTAKTEEDRIHELVVRAHIPVNSDDFDLKRDEVLKVAEEIYEHSTMEKDFDEVNEVITTRYNALDAEDIYTSGAYMGEASSAFGSLVEENILMAQSYGSESRTDDYFDFVFAATDLDDDGFQSEFETMQKDAQAELEAEEN